MELIINYVNGNFRTYVEVRSPLGYCFYDVDEQDRSYTNYIATPILNIEELKRKFILVEGDADKLNQELQNKNIVE